MKNDYKYYLIVIFLSLLPLTGIFITPLLYHTHDGFAHLARIPAYYKALKDFEFPVRWAGDLNFGYGMPLFNFMYQVPYFLASVLLFIGFNLVSSFKIIISLSFVLSGIWMYLFTKEFFQDSKKALLITVFYQFAPFRLIELLVRGSFGEVYTYAFLPLVLFGIVRTFKKNTYFNFFLTSISCALLVLSHNALSLVFFGICLGFIFLFSPNKKALIYSLAGLIAGLLLSSFYWFPAILEHKYTYGDLFMKDLYLQHFPPLQNFFIPNFFNDSRLQTKGISVQIGLFHTLAILLSVIVLIRNKTDTKTKKIIIGSLLVFVVTLFFMQPISKFIWAHMAILRQFQFSWRFLAIVCFVSSFTAVSLFSFSLIKNKWLYTMLIFLVVITTAYYWKPPLGYDKIDENYYWKFPFTSTYFGETDVIWSAGPAKAYPSKRVEFINGKGKINNFVRKNNSQEFSITSNSDSSLVDHLEYFPGWRVYVNGKSVPIQFQDPNWRGQIIFSVPKGKSEVKVKFGETPLRLIADIISFLTGVFLIIMFFTKKFYFYENKRD